MALTIAVVGVVAAGMGNLVLLLDAQRQVALRRSHLVGQLERGLMAAAAVKPRDPLVRVRVAGSGRYHRPSCLLVQGKRTRRVSGTRTSLAPCEMCQP